MRGNNILDLISRYKVNYKICGLELTHDYPFPECNKIKTHIIAIHRKFILVK